MLDSDADMCKYAKIFVLLQIIGLWASFALPAAASVPINQPPPEEIPAPVVPSPSSPVPKIPDVPLITPLVTANYFPLLPFGATDDTLPQFLAVGSNHILDEDHHYITNAIIVIHDQMRDAASSLALMRTLAGSANATTLILAPQFLLEADILRYRSSLPEQGKLFARWSLNEASSPWEDGGDSVVKPPERGISSFTAIDLMMLYLADRTRFPNMQQIVIAGHGAGGDFVQRYAAIGQAAEILEGKHLPVRYVVANPSSYLYFTPVRPQKGKHGFVPPDAATCPDYDNYKYGLEHLNDYARRVGANAIKLRYPDRNVMYFIGEKVTAQDSMPDASCAALLQGLDRMTRAQNYSQYLGTLFGDGPQQPQNFVNVPKIGFDAAGIFASRCGIAALFGDGVCR